MSCDRLDCRNRDKSCHLCSGYRFYEPQKMRKRLGKRIKKDGVDFENEVVADWNDMVLGKRVFGSGAFPGLDGDVDLVEMLGECKLRGTVNARGEETFSVTKGMLKKIKQEANYRKIPVLPFKFKGDNTTYIILEYDDILALFQELMELRAGKEV